MKKRFIYSVLMVLLLNACSKNKLDRDKFLGVYRFDYEKTITEYNPASQDYQTTLVKDSKIVFIDAPKDTIYTNRHIVLKNLISKDIVAVVLDKYFITEKIEGVTAGSGKLENNILYLDEPIEVASYAIKGKMIRQ